MLYCNVETFIGRKTLFILKSCGIKQRFKSRVTAQVPENVIGIYIYIYMSISQDRGDWTNFGHWGYFGQCCIFLSKNYNFD